MQRGVLGDMPCNASGNKSCRRSACLRHIRNAADRSQRILDGQALPPPCPMPSPASYLNLHEGMTALLPCLAFKPANTLSAFLCT